MHGEASAKFPLVPQLSQGELFQYFTAAPSTYPHNAGLLTPVDTCGEKWSTAELRGAMLDSLRGELYVFGVLCQLVPEGTNWCLQEIYPINEQYGPRNGMTCREVKCSA